MTMTFSPLPKRERMAAQEAAAEEAAAVAKVVAEEAAAAEVAAENATSKGAFPEADPANAEDESEVEAPPDASADDN